MHFARSTVIVLLAVLGASALSTSALAQTPSGASCLRAGVDDKCESWVTSFDDNEVATVATESPTDLATSPDGETVYTAMRTVVGVGFDSTSQWTIIAYDDTGAQKWLARWGDPTKYNFVSSIVASPDGKLVFVSGTWRVDQVATDGHLTTVALDAATGAKVWESNYDGPGAGTDNARDIVVSPDGRTLYIAGISAGTGNGDLDFAVIAYDTRTGAERWVTRWDGIGANRDDSPFAIDLNRRGTMLYLTGWSYGEGEFNNDYGTIAVRTKGPDAGDIEWTARYDGVGNRAPDQASALAVSPDGSTVFVTGMSDDVDSGPPFAVNYGFATVAYDALTGELLWEARKQWEETKFNSPNGLAIDPTGKYVVVTGQANQRQIDFGTVTYDAKTGAEVWSDRYGYQDYDLELAKTIAMDPRGDTVYVAGVSAKSPPGVPGVVLYAPNADQLTIAYDVATGAKKWLARYNDATTDFVSIQSLAIAPDASTLYALSSVDDQNWDNDGDDVDAALMAYDVGPGIPLPPPPSTSVTFTERTGRGGQYSDTGVFEARLVNSFGDPVEDAPLDISFGTETMTATTDAAGLARVTARLTVRPGAYPLEVSYKGEQGAYAPSEAQVIYEVDRENARLAGLRRNGRNVSVRLVDADSGAPLQNRKITFYAWKKKLGADRTDRSGIAAIRLGRGRIPSARSLKAFFAGDAFYLPRRS